MSAKEQKDLPESGQDQNVEQIREILFGGHIRDYEKRFNGLSRRVDEEADALRKSLEKRALELEKLLSEFQDETQQRLGSEAADRDKGLNAAESALKQFRLDTENHIAGLEDEYRAELKTLQDNLKDLRKALLADADQREDKLSQRLQQIDSDKVDRHELADFLQNIAKGLVPASGQQEK